MFHVSLFTFMKRKEEENWISQARDVEVVIDIDRHIKTKINMIQLTERDVKIIKSVQPLIKERIDEIVEDFYSKILSVPSKIARLCGCARR